MDDALWGAYDPQSLQQVGLFHGVESQSGILSSLHVESPYQQYWGSDAWRPDEIPDITLIPVDPFDPVLSLPAVTGETSHDFAGAPSKFPLPGQQLQQQWGHPEFYPPPPPDVHEILSSQFMQFNSSTLPPPHLPQDFHTFKPFSTVTSVQQSRPVSVPYGGPSSMAPGSRPVSTTNAMSYGGSSVPMGMFATTNVPQRIMSTSGIDGGCHSNIGLLQHIPKGYHPLAQASKIGGNVAATDLSVASTFVANQKSGALSPLADSSSSRRRDSVVEETKMASFNPGPYVNSARAVVPTPKPQEDVHRMWMDDSNRGKSSAVPIPNSGHRHQHQHQQAMSTSSPVTNLGFEQQQRPMSNTSPAINRGFEQRVMSNPSSVSNMGFEPRHPNSMSNSSPPARIVFEHIPNQPMTSSSPIPTIVGLEQGQSQRQPMTSSSPIPTVVGFEPCQPQRQPMTSSPPVPIMGLRQQHQPPVTSTSPISISGIEPRQQQKPLQQPMSSSSSPTPNVGGQQPTVSASPPLSNLTFEPRQALPPPPPPPSMSSSPSTSNLVFEPRRPPSLSNSSTLPNLARQQPAASNNPRPDAGESAPKWPSLRMIGGCPVVSGSEKTPIMRQQPETGTIKCALPRTISTNSSASANPNPVNKRPLWPDDNKNQGGSMNKKPMQKWQGTAGCSRLEEISAAAHQKVTQNTSGRALGPALNTNLKPRARQGSANDPQSIAARVRRERISERLKVLQTLIPNGDKVDMVTMLEKAINYVQCLELQIRMLKNDSLWPKALGPLPNTLQELLELAGPELLGGKEFGEEAAAAATAASEIPTIATPPATTKKSVAPEVIEFDGHQPSADKE